MMMMIITVIIIIIIIIIMSLSVRCVDTRLPSNGTAVECQGHGWQPHCVYGIWIRRVDSGVLYQESCLLLILCKNLLLMTDLVRLMSYFSQQQHRLSKFWCLALLWLSGCLLEIIPYQTTPIARSFWSLPSDLLPSESQGASSSRIHSAKANTDCGEEMSLSR